MGSLQMFLQKLFWSIKTLNYLNPFIDCINSMHQWFYPKSSPFIQIDVTRYDILRIMIKFYTTSPSDNMLAIRILSACKVSLHRMNAQKGWQVEEDEINFVNLSNKLLQCIQSDLLSPKKTQFLQKLFENN